MLGLTLPASAFSPFEAESFQNFSSLVGTSSTWVNQSGSSMTISVSRTADVTGQYINRAAGTGCQNTPYQIAGRVDGDFIAFTVAWNNGTENCNSVTGWAGYAQASSGNIEIVTNWNLAYQGPSGPAIQQGNDTFIYQPQKTGSLVPQ
ncbi:hypothetical protein E1297_29025 [Roseibium sp. RKSG952]|nr:hypothetical protein [Roseibium sp. RKSG952]